MSVEKICEEANKLSVVERGELISRLILDLGQPEYDVGDEEVSLRFEETRSGSVEDISQDELISRLEHLR
ncbi:MAG: hypothetical protein F7B06_00735 [Opitutae bacterium]|nr:hypothetical protein [Opitutae bacterium]